MNACLDSHVDAAAAPLAPAEPLFAPVCAICTRDLTPLTPAARAEHANRCADSTLLGRDSLQPHVRPRSGATKPAQKQKKERKGDARVRRLLELLGLGRYAERFAQEEIDLVALRLLDDDDFAQLKIPDAARRRIAEAMHSVPILAQIQAEARREREGDREMGEEDEVVPTQQFPESRLGQTMRRREPLQGDESSDDDVYRPTQAPREAADAWEDGVTSSPFRNRDGIDESSHLPRGKKKSASPVALPKRNRPRSPFKQNATRSPLKESASRSPFSGSKDNAPLSPNLRFAKGANFNSSACAPESNSAAFSGEAPQGWTANGALSSASEHDGDSSDVSSLRNFERELHGTSQISLRTKLDRWRRKQIKREKQNHKREIEQERKRHKIEIEKIQARYEGMQKRVDASPDPAGNVQPLRKVSNEPVAAAVKDDLIDLTQHISSDDEDKIEKVVTPHAQRKFPNTQVNESIVISSARKNRTPSWFSDASLDIPQLKEPPKQATNRAEYFDRQPETGLFMSSDEEVMDLTCPESEQITMPIAMPEDENTRQSDAGVGGDRDIDKDGETLSKSGTERQSQAEDAPVESRLKKRPKKVATREEILAAIRTDTALYDDILFMHTVPFERVFESVKGSGVKVSKLALHDLLRKEGIAFKADPPKNGEPGKAYFRRLAVEYD